MSLANKKLNDAKSMGNSLVLIYADVDNLKVINDSLGHDAGDEAIVEIAGAMRNAFRESDVIGRLGGDEFAILINGSDIDNQDRESLCRRLDILLDKLNSGPNRVYQLSISMGVTEFDPLSPSDLETLMSRADVQVYQHKKSKYHLKSVIGEYLSQ